MVTRQRVTAMLVGVLACTAASCNTCAPDPNQFTADGALDHAVFVAEAHLEDTTACVADCGWQHNWRYKVVTTQAHIGVAPPSIVTAYNHYAETDVLVAARRFANNKPPRFFLVGDTVLGPGGEEGAICGLPPSVPVMLLSGDNVFVFNEAGDGLATLTEVMLLHDGYPEDGRKGGYTFQQRANAYAKQRPLKTALDAVERSRARRPTREPFNRDGAERVCHTAAEMDSGSGTLPRDD